MSKIATFFQSKKVKTVALGLAFILLILLIAFLFPKGTTNQNATVKDNLSYVESTEKKLEEVLSKIEGAGKVKVVITTDAPQKYEYAEKSTVRTENGQTVTTTEILFIDGEPVILRELTPTIHGILIVCEGGAKIPVITKIQEAVQTLLDVDAKKIEILPMQK